MTDKLFVGFKTKAVDGVEALMPTFTPAKNLTDPKKIEQDLADKKEKFLREAPNMPYTGTFEEVFIIDPKNEKRLQYLASDGKDAKAPVASRVRTYLLKTFPNAWPEDTHEIKKPEVVFVGFNPRLFLKMLGIECSLPHIAKPLLPKMWYSNSDHRDIEEALIPAEFNKMIDLATALKRRRPLDEPSAKRWDVLLAGYTQPGDNPMKDAQLAFELAVQLGFI